MILTQEQINELDIEKINKINEMEKKSFGEVQCGSNCTSDLACKSFSYDPIAKRCMVSPNLTQNKLSMITCNKINPIRDFDLIDDINLVRNSVYYCFDGTHPKRINNLNQNENRIQYVNNRKIILQTSKDHFIDGYPAPILSRYQFTNL